MKAVLVYPLIAVIFFLLRNMSQLQPCLLVSERHQSNSRWGAIITVQMREKVKTDRADR